MPRHILMAALLAGLAIPAAAQDDAPGAGAADDATESPSAAEQGGAGTGQSGSGQGNAQAPQPSEELSLGEPAANADGVGQTYIAEESGDWQVRCIRTESGADPCQLYQLLNDQNDNAVAEITIFPLEGDERVAAGATIVTPLETLLTQQLRLSVDGGNERAYPFAWCSEVGCFSRVGFTGEELNAFRRGNAARVRIVPAAAPDQTVDLSVSLSGFTAGFEAVNERNAQAEGQAGPGGDSAAPEGN